MTKDLLLGILLGTVGWTVFVVTVALIAQKGRKK
jgi:hypothetical protein